MKVHLVVSALVLLQLVCPGSATVLRHKRNVPELKEIFNLAVNSSATIPEVRVDRF